MSVQLCMCYKRMKQLFFFLIMFEPVKVEQIINSKSMRSCNELSRGISGLQRTRGTDANDVNRRKCLFYLPCFKINIDKCINFI